MVESLLTKAEVAAKLKCSMKTVERILADKALPFRRVGRIGPKSTRPRNVRISESDLDAFVRFGPKRDVA